MRATLCVLLMLGMKQCEGQPVVGTTTVRMGDDVEMTCVRTGAGNISWNRLVSGSFQVLGKTNSLDTFHSHIKAASTRGLFVLRVEKAKLSDTAVYFCLKISRQTLTFLNGTDLRVEGPGSDADAVPSSSDPAGPEGSAFPPGPVLSETEEKIQSPEERCVCRFGDRSNPDVPSTDCTPGELCRTAQDPEGLPTKTFYCSFPRMVNCPETGIQNCTSATCQEMFSANISKRNFEADCRQNYSVLPVSLLCTALALSLLLIGLLISSVRNLKEKSKFYHSAMPANELTSGFHEGQQKDEDSLLYSVVNFTHKASEERPAATSDVNTAENEIIYAGIKKQT